MASVEFVWLPLENLFAVVMQRVLQNYNVRWTVSGVIGPEPGKLT